MLNVSESASNVLRSYLAEQNIHSIIRITPMAGCCFGPRLRIQVSDVKESDCVFEWNGIKFVVAKKLLEACGTINVDYVAASGCSCCSGCAGFRISGEKKYSFAGRCTIELNRCDTLGARSSLPGSIHLNNTLDFLR